MYGPLLNMLGIVSESSHAAEPLVHRLEADPAQLISVHIRGAPQGGAQHADSGAQCSLYT